MAKSKKFTAEELEIIASIQSERGTTRKRGIRYFQKNRDQYMRRSTKAAVTPAVVDHKMAAANDRPEAEEIKAPAPKLPAKNASAVAKGAAYAVLAGRPSKDAVIACFGKSGYVLSWVARAERLGIPVEELCQRFRDDATQVKQQWTALNSQKAAQ